jgi:uncharacterized protein (UPF0128 family)
MRASVFVVQGKKEKTEQSEELAFQLGEKRIQLGLGMQAKAIHKSTGLAEDVVVYFGIIDYLQVRCRFSWATRTASHPYRH